MFQDHLGRGLGGILAANTLDKVIVGICDEQSASSQANRGTDLTHQVKVDAVVHEVILAGLDIPGRAKVHAVLTADVLDLLIGTRQAHNTRVEFLQVLAQHLGGIASGVAGNENRQEKLVVLGRLLDLVDDLGHLVQLVRADIGAVGETEVDLQQNDYQHCHPESRA